MRTKLLLLATVSLLLAAAVECGSFYAFHNLLNERKRENALFTVYGRGSDGNRMNVPSIEPYIWSNYKPNPRSKKANEWGWRYGGGPDRHAFRILCLGGSTTWSAKASSPERSYPARLESYLRSEGYDVDVVNGGVPYFTSAELVGTLAFRGIYTKPDLVIIHTGGNDSAPLRSPHAYKPDYTHWRTVRPDWKTVDKPELFRVLWQFPSWFSRLLLTLKINPNPFYRNTLARQVTSPQAGLLAESDISNREPVGLKKNLTTLIATARSHGADVVSMTFKMSYDRLHHLVPQLKGDEALSRRVTQRLKVSIDKSNAAIRDISEKLRVSVIPFHEFNPSRPDYWADQAHLSDEGLVEKAEFVGRWLIANNTIPR
jgi:hypothetical protein